MVDVANAVDANGRSNIDAEKGNIGGNATRCKTVSSRRSASLDGQACCLGAPVTQGWGRGIAPYSPDNVAERLRVGALVDGTLLASRV